MVLKTGLDRSVRMVEPGIGGQSCPKKGQKKLVKLKKKTDQKLGTRGKFGFAPVRFLKSWLILFIFHFHPKQSKNNK